MTERPLTHTDADNAMPRGVTTVYVHGVGMWPDSFAGVTARVPGEHLVWVRPGYERRPAVATLGDQVRHLRTAVQHHAPARVVGVSGGATLALALAMNDPDGLVAIVTHEPLIGALEPELHARVSAAGERLRRAPGPEAADAFVRGLYGARSWARTSSTSQDWAVKHYRTICREVSHFASFQPTAEDLRVSVPHTTSVGRRSGPDRHGVAETLAASGAVVVALDTGHFAHVDDPVAFSAMVAESPCGDAP